MTRRARGRTRPEGRRRRAPAIRASRVGRWLGSATLLGATAVAGGCAGLRDGALDPRGPVAERQLTLFVIALIVAGLVFVVVTGLWIYALVRRRRDDDRERFPGTRFVAIGGFVVPSVILIGMMVVTSAFLARETTSGDLVIQVTGHQFWWEARYPDADVVTANEIHIPVGEDVEFVLESEDVIHSFWVPQLGGKKDLIPGRRNRLVLHADEPGTYRGACAEYCGLQHAKMELFIVAQSRDEFETWLEDTAADAVVADARAEEAFNRNSCAACHVIRGTDAERAGVIGPDLTHFGSRTTIGAGALENTPDNLAAWIVNSQAIKPGNRMPPLPIIESEELDILVEYLESLQ